METYPILDINSDTFHEDLVQKFKEYGVCVIENIIDDETCDQYCNDILDSFVQISGNRIDKNDLAGTWKKEYLPQQTRTGLFQKLIGNLQCVWDIRGNETIVDIFRTLYSHFRQKDITDLIVSGDGINFHPAHIKASKRAKSWEHLDQTDGDIYKCVQGQVVLADSESSFVCTPKSHLRFHEILDKFNARSKKNWLMFNDKQKSELHEMFTENHLIPIIAKKGSLIIWTSSTIHCARIQKEPVNPRCIVYVSYHPKDELDKRTINRRKKCYEENRMTNHWISKMFAKIDLHVPKYDDEMLDIVKNPIKVYDVLGKPQLTDLQKQLCGY